MTPPLAPPAILVVDDHPANLAAMKQVLGQLSARIHLASSGRDALLLCMEQEFAVVLLDVQMPEMDGYEVARLLRGAHTHTPILFLTAVYGDEHHALQGYDAGAVDYIFKPVNDRILLAKTRVFLDLFLHRQQLGEQAAQIRERNARLQELEERSRLVLEHMPVLVVALDDRGRVVAWNRAAEQATGYGAAEMIGHDLSRLYPGQMDRLLAAWRGEESAWGDGRWDTLRRDGTACVVKWIGLAGAFPVPGWASWQVGLDITEQARMEGEILRSREELRSLASHMEQVREEERQWISREVHDELGSNLTRLKLELHHLSTRVTQAEDEKRLLEALALAEDTLNKARNVSQSLRPSVLDQFGLLAGLEWLAMEYGRRSRIPCAVRAGTPQIRLDAARETALFRICQEALTNVVRHSQATRVLVELLVEGEQVILRITDNGRGMEADATPAMGLLGMRERARQLGGRLTMEERPEGGTVLAVCVPRLGEEGA